MLDQYEKSADTLELEWFLFLVIVFFIVIMAGGIANNDEWIFVNMRKLLTNTIQW